MSTEFVVDARNAPPLVHSGDELWALYRLTDKLYRATRLDQVYEAALESITETLGCSRASILLFDQSGVMQFVAWRGLSDGYRNALTGHSPWKPSDCEPDPIFVCDIEQTNEPPVVKETIKRENIRALAFIPLTAQGKVIGKFMTYHEQPKNFTSHEADIAVAIARQVGFSVERHNAEAARRLAEEKVRESESRFKTMSEAAPVMIWMSDQNGGCLHLNRMLRDFWGVPEAGVSSFDWRTTMHPDDIGMVTEKMMGAIVGRHSVSLNARYKDKEGRYRVLHTDARPRFASDGTFIGMIGVNVDVTERELLLAELSHRVKNTLAVVQGIAHQTFKTVDQKHKRAFEGRLVALSIAHNLLVQSNWQGASMQSLATDSLLNAGFDGRIQIRGPEVIVSSKQAVVISMVLHELLTNAIKHGALSNEAGTIECVWHGDPSDARKIELLWQERGGPAVVAPTSKGFGSFLLNQAVSGDLQGNVSTEYSPSGVRCKLEFSIANDVV